MTSGMVRVVVTGHTDPVGSQVYNQGLSERRAASVENEMVRLGLNANNIQTVGRSFMEPLVRPGRASASRRTAEPSSISVSRPAA